MRKKKRGIHSASVPRADANETQSNGPHGLLTDEPMVGPDYVAVRLGVPKSWVYAKSEAGELPSYKIGWYRRFKWSEIQGYLRECHSNGKPHHSTVQGKGSGDGKTPNARRTARGVLS